MHFHFKSTKDLIFYLTPLLIVIFLYELVAIEVYIHSPIATHKIRFFLWIGCQAIGGIFLGYIADRFSRKNTLITIQIIGGLLLLISFQINFKEIGIVFLGLFFSPSPIARAILLDKFVELSKVQLLAITFIAQFIPWCFYIKIQELGEVNIIALTTILLMLNALLSYLFLDTEKKRTFEVSPFKPHHLIFKHKRMQLYVSLIAFLCGQICFFIVDSFFEVRQANANLFANLGIGSLIGSIVAIFYTRLPHFALLTVCYSVGFIISLDLFITGYFLEYPTENQLVFFSIMGGYYLPFIFDAVLSATHKEYHGTVCSIVDAMTSISATLGVLFILLYKPDILIIVLNTSCLFFLAIVMQRIGEDYVCEE